MFLLINDILFNVHNIEVIKFEEYENPRLHKKEQAIIVYTTAGNSYVAYSGDYPYCRKMYEHLQDCIRQGMQEQLYKAELR